MLAAKHPDRVLSLTSIMSTTGNPEVGQPTPEAMVAMLTPMPGDRDGLHRRHGAHLRGDRLARVSGR